MRILFAPAKGPTFNDSCFEFSRWSTILSFLETLLRIAMKAPLRRSLVGYLNVGEGFGLWTTLGFPDGVSHSTPWKNSLGSPFLLVRLANEPSLEYRLCARLPRLRIIFSFRDVSKWTFFFSCMTCQVKSTVKPYSIHGNDGQYIVDLKQTQIRL